MIRLYCRKKHGTKKNLCPECEALSQYAMQRSDKCPFMETKTFCSNCRVHCYKPEMREKIREVMRFSGPRMILHHPVMAVRHVIESKGKETIGEENTKIKRLLWIILGFIGLGIGAVGVVCLCCLPFRFFSLQRSASAKARRDCISGSSVRSSIKTIWNPM
ncbi:MAG: nitrous oxide-stimulated promoter family protein [Gallintestinimicrobium sp.]